MWQRFTERARKAVFYAQEEAQRFGEGYVSTEHLLLGLLRDVESLAGEILLELEVDPGQLRDEVQKHLPRGEPRAPQDMTLTPRAKHVIDLAYDEARNLNNSYIGTEHLLLGLIREPDGLASAVLSKLGVRLEAARKATLLLQGREEASPGPTGGALGFLDRLRRRQLPAEGSCVIVIPARMASTRFPGKPLCDLLGKPMIQWVWERAKAAEITDEVVIATPDHEIVEACAAFGATAILTRGDHPSGTDRIEEVSSQMGADLYINVQGDEPLMRPDDIRALAKPMLAHPQFRVGSLYTDCAAEEEENPAVVKVALSQAGHALYFSRYPIPYARNERVRPLAKHLGLYAYRRSALESFIGCPPTPLELTESLEQLRFLEMGIPIQMFKGQGSEMAVDTPEQAEQVRELLRREEGAG